ncbi:MAG: hypothetical protein K2M31_01690 [Muribaculaceae bacterium]|nr:hypothetical protein [Muribaculaceae bacterium]
MKSLVLHIEYLLHRHDCVILPGIGAFVAEHESASIDYVNGRIFPPSTTVSFNDAIIHDDGMIVNSIARAEQIKYEEAEIILNQYLSEISADLLRDNEAQLGKLGRLVKNENDTLQFIPRMSESQLQITSGTPILDCKIHQDSSAEQKSASVHVPIHSTSDITLSESETLPPDSYIKVLSNKNYYIPVNKIFARCAASLIVIAAIALSFIVPQPKGNIHEVKASLNPVETLSSRQSEARRIESPQPESIVDPERDDSMDDHVKDESSFVASPSGYYLIVATFTNRHDAELYMSKRAGGEFPLQAIERNGLYRISAAHGDYRTLRSILNSSEYRAAFSEAWIWNSDKN